VNDGEARQERVGGPCDRRFEGAVLLNRPSQPEVDAAPMKRPNELATAKAVGRTRVPCCSGSHRL